VELFCIIFLFSLPILERGGIVWEMFIKLQTEIRKAERRVKELENELEKTTRELDRVREENKALRKDNGD
jgi:uncharacterized membrane protein YciS (DUF1049 family)